MKRKKNEGFKGMGKEKLGILARECLKNVAGWGGDQPNVCVSNAFPVKPIC